jgi:hypothetical protein
MHTLALLHRRTLHPRTTTPCTYPGSQHYRVPSTEPTRKCPTTNNNTCCTCWDPCVQHVSHSKLPAVVCNSAGVQCNRARTSQALTLQIAVCRLCHIACGLIGLTEVPKHNPSVKLDPYPTAANVGLHERAFWHVWWSLCGLVHTWLIFAPYLQRHSRIAASQQTPCCILCPTCLHGAADHTTHEESVTCDQAMCVCGRVYPVC